MNHSLFGKFSFLCGFTLPWELGFLKLGELGYLGLHQAQFFPVASAEASPRTQWWEITPPKASSLWQQAFYSASWHIKGRSLLQRSYNKDLMHTNHSWTPVLFLLFQLLLSKAEGHKYIGSKTEALMIHFKLWGNHLAIWTSRHISKYFIHFASKSAKFYLSRN